MTERADDRVERREEIKLRLKSLKVMASLAVIAIIVFAGLQWRIASLSADFANRRADEHTYQRMTNEWRDHLKIFVEKPDLRPYFDSKKELSPNDPNTQAVLALADVRLDVADAILTYATLRGASDQIDAWKNTVHRAFQTSPVLCLRFSETRSSYGLVVPIAGAACVR